MRIKKILAVLLVLAMIPSLFACSQEAEEKREVIVFAASSLTEVLTRIGEEYERSHPDIALRFQFDSSGTLKTQIAEGAECDIFISAAPKQMNELADRIIPETRVDLLENKVVLAVPDGNPAEISSFDDLMDRLQAGTVRLAVGNSDVPVGQYTQKILDYFGMDEGDMGGGVSYCTSAKQVAVQVTEAVVDCGILYATDAASAGLTVVDTALAEHCGQVLYPAALLQGADMDAQYFLHYLQGDMAEEFFVQAGFTHLDEY